MSNKEEKHRELLSAIVELQSAKNKLLLKYMKETERIKKNTLKSMIEETEKRLLSLKAQLAKNSL